MRLEEFLSKKPLFYKKFDPMRMQRAYESIKEYIHLPPSIQIIGTNGKGSTGRFLAGMLKEAGFKVGHYTSPHIFRFNERIWIDGKEIEDSDLEDLHQRLQHLLSKEFLLSLSYFEYTTFLAALAFEGLEYAIFEAGLGGEYDATSVFEYGLTLVTPIGFDHQEFLGESIEEIATTKLRAIQKEAIIGCQKYDEVFEVAKGLGVKYQKAPVQKLKELPPFLAHNYALATAAFLHLTAQSPSKRAMNYRLPGRAQRIKNVLIDVGHNELSAQEIVELLDKEVVLVYNSYADKDYKKILEILSPKIKRVEILEIQTPRIAPQSDLIKAAKALNLKVREFDGIDPKEEYLVYGSFSVVEEFIRRCGQNIMSI